MGARTVPLRRKSREVEALDPESQRYAFDTFLKSANPKIPELCPSENRTL
jgi:hypothetical protein